MRVFPMAFVEIVGALTGQRGIQPLRRVAVKSD
jgi:hypothetical protein